MSTVLSEMQFEILPSVTAETGEAFGIGLPVSVDDGGFLPGDDDWTHQDQADEGRGGMRFGRDVLAGPTWGWNLHVNETDVPSAIATLSRFKAAWRALKVRNTPGAMVAIRYRLADRYRVIYGRPRRFSAPPTNEILSGKVPITCDFQCVDAFTYDDEQQVVQLTLQQGSEGGFTFPTVFPVTTLPVGGSAQQAVVGGDAPTYPIVRFNGPVVNPVLETDEWSLTLDLSIQADQYVEIDLRPWVLTALLNGTASVADSLDRRQYLSDISLEPGPHTLTFRGSSESSSATCAVRWSNAHNSI
jgi:hypothetical protein